jgi:hypothetical protein
MVVVLTRNLRTRKLKKDDDSKPPFPSAAKIRAGQWSHLRTMRVKNQTTLNLILAMS